MFLAGEYLRNLSGRHLPLGVFLRGLNDLFALADRGRGRRGWGLSRGRRGVALELGAARVLAGLRIEWVS